MQKEWFAEWFDSPYYHLLYQNHDEHEAQLALDNLLSALRLPAQARVLDLACGKGRHSRYLAECGYAVTGLDISFKSISYAAQFAHDGLEFYQHDMRLPFRTNYFDAVVNFFTSFGYFDSDADHVRTLRNVARGLRPEGQFLLDFFNARWVRQILVPQATKTVGGLTFHLQKRIENGHVFKHVEFETEGRHYKFEERVRLFELADFEHLFEQAGLRIHQVFGDYDLQEFDPEHSKRLIVLATKPA
jgi:SAM-dependent methyltransferase